MAVANAGTNFSCKTGEAIVLDGSASSDYVLESQADGSFSVRWDPGDGCEPVENVIRPGHSYLRAGVYTATLTVKNAAGQSSTDTVQVTVTDIPAATAGNIQTLIDTGNKATNLTNLSAALATAAANSATNEIHLPAGFAFNDPLEIPARAATNYVTVRVADLSALPERKRVTAADKSKLARMEVRNYSASEQHHGIHLGAGAHYYRFIGIETRSIVHANTKVHVAIDGGADNSHIIFDRCLIDGNGYEVKTGIAPNCKEFSLVNSSILDIKAAGVETKGISQWYGGGPQAYINNRIEAAAINFMIGGAYVGAAENVLNGLCFRGNYSYKNPAWVGNGYNIKNQWELKQGINVACIGNVFENNYWEGQNGVAILLKPCTQADSDGANGPYPEVKYVDFGLNKVLNTRAAYTIVRMQSLSEPIAQPLHHVRLRHNHFQETYSTGNLIQMPDNLEIYKNTHTATHQPTPKDQNFYLEYGAIGKESTTLPSHVGVGFKIIGNSFPAAQYNFVFTSYGANSAGLAAVTSGSVVTGNLIAGQNPAALPGSNITVADEAAYRANFTDYNGGNLLIKSGGTGKGAMPDGSDVGADITRLNAATASALSGVWNEVSNPNGRRITTWGDGIIENTLIY